MLDKKRSRERIVIPVLVVFLLIISLLSLRFGSAKMSAKEFFSALFDKSSGSASVIIYSVRLPRLLAGLVAGCGLALSGVLLQTVTDNSLASPNVVGVNAGAGFGVVIALAVLPASIGALSYLLLPLIAFVSALITTFIVLIISRAAGGSRSSIVLAGVAVTALLNAFISAANLADSDILSSYNAFSVGGFNGVAYIDMILPAGIVAACFVISLILSGKTELLALGPTVASSLGVKVSVVRTVSIICAAASAAAVVSFAGLLGFVGLIVPHIARFLVGSRPSRMLPASMLVGASVCVLADYIGRIVIAPSELPVGITMAFVGAPFFVFLLFRKRGESQNGY